MTGSPSTLVGTPWEIQRTTDLTPEHPHTIDLYFKSGGAYGYISRIVAVDQYGIGFVLLTAGPPEVSTILNDVVVGSLLPAIEKETRDQAQEFVGNFTTDNPSSSEEAKKQKDAPITVALSMDDGPGLILDSITRNGTSIIDGLVGIWDQMLPMIGQLKPNFRIYPAELELPVHADDKDVYSNLGYDQNSSTNPPRLIRQDWRINLDIVLPGEDSDSALPGKGSLKGFCSNFQTIDWLVYGGEALDRIVFVLEEESRKVVGVEIPALRSGRLAKKN